MLSNYVQPLQAEASSELETKKQELEASIVRRIVSHQFRKSVAAPQAQVAAVTEELRASEAKAVKSTKTPCMRAGSVWISC